MMELIDPTTSPADMEMIREWFSCHFANSSDLPLSFSIAGEAIRGIPEEWNPVSEKRRVDANILEAPIEANDAETGLYIRVEVTRYGDYPVVEWLAWLENRGTEPTPVIEDILAMDGIFTGNSPVLQHSTGDFCSEEGYAPLNTSLSPGDSIRLSPNGGRPCDGVFPYFRLLFDGSGRTLAVGWPGQWGTEFEGNADGVRVRVGQERTNLRLMPGEKIRTPRVTVLFWLGDESRGINMWRRWYLSHILPRPDGRPIRPRLCCEGPGDGVEFTAATEENQLRFIPKAAERGIPFDIWWIDAGWYPCYNEKGDRDWTVTGTWEPDPERFPDGLKRVSDCAAEHGADLLLWFEPERVRPGTKLDREHPEWLLRTKEYGPSGMLYLGNPECRRWLTDHVCRLIEDNGIKIYRQDHNFPPLDFWRENDGPEREGIHENLHVQGYLRYWDELLARNPGLWIDSCASGGRRNDLETLRRSVPLHYTDYGYGDHQVKLAFHHTLYAWIPYFREQAVSWDIEGRTRFLPTVDSFSFHCAMAPAMTTSLDIRRDDHDYELARKMIDIWRSASFMLLNGDYYPLTPFHRSAGKWVVRQFDCPGMGRGLVQAIRLQESPQEKLAVDLRAIRPDRSYEFSNPETGENRMIKGEVLARDGFTFELPARSGSIWFYGT